MPAIRNTRDRSCGSRQNPLAARADTTNETPNPNHAASCTASTQVCGAHSQRYTVNSARLRR
jgi:hypothetical protein